MHRRPCQTVPGLFPLAKQHIVLPLCLAGLGRWDEAVQYYSKAYQISPEFSFAAANRALALYQVGQADQAIRWALRLCRRMNDSMTACMSIAVPGTAGLSQVQQRINIYVPGRRCSHKAACLYCPCRSPYLRQCQFCVRVRHIKVCNFLFNACCMDSAFTLANTPKHVLAEVKYSRDEKSEHSCA